MNEEKKKFLQQDFILLLKKLDADTKGKWGVMNAQQMVEHFVDTVKNASGKLILPVVNTGERLEKLREFLMTEKQFKENTKNPLIGDAPFPLRKANINAAIEKLREELNYFFQVFRSRINKKLLIPASIKTQLVGFTRFRLMSFQKPYAIQKGRPP